MKALLVNVVFLLFVAQVLVECSSKVEEGNDVKTDLGNESSQNEESNQKQHYQEYLNEGEVPPLTSLPMDRVQPFLLRYGLTITNLVSVDGILTKLHEKLPVSNYKNVLAIEVARFRSLLAEKRKQRDEFIKQKEEASVH